MTESNKATEAAAAKADNPQVEAPPSYTPRAMSPITRINPPPTTSTPLIDTEPPAPRQIHVQAPSGPFLNDPSKLGGESANIICPRCHYGVQTSTRTRAGTHAAVWSVIACFTCGIIAAILPLVIPACQDIEHTCPNCGFLMARFRRGVREPKVFPVENGYIPVNQEEPRGVPPPAELTQQTGVTDSKN